ncbi:MAG: PD40 domain-containing protein [Dehalococcoidales bacterium]|nr:PD40 domain-containing protein [Dehalococcoidales bacterium]
MKRIRSSARRLSHAGVYLKPLVSVWLLLAPVTSLACAPAPPPPPPAPEAGVEASVTTGEAPLTVVFTNRSVNADEFRWDYGDGTTGTTGAVVEPGTHEYTEAGTHTVTLTATQEGEPPLTSTATATVTVKHGLPDRLILAPETVELSIGQTQEFSTEVFDAYGNEILDAELSWDVAAEAGTITDDDVLTAGTKAGTFEEAVVVTVTRDGDSLTATASVKVNPGPLDAVRTSSIQLGAGQSNGFNATATDQHGNRLTGVDMAWTVTNRTAGSVTSGGSFTAGTVPGTYSGAVKVTATQGGITKTASAGVTVTAGPLAEVFIAPTRAETGMEMTQQFVAAGADQYGNRISGLSLTWSVENGAGTIDENGLFTAGTTPGDYAGALKAEATSGGTTKSATADVTVEPDRIIFLSDQNDDQWDLYIIEADGGNQERLTTSGVKLGHYDLSPDGRRVIFNIDEDIYTVNDDGTWWTTLLSGRQAYEPAWSPDGSKIAFQSWEHDPSEIYVMDVDGGNLVRLTDNSAYDDYPAWSPDGSSIAFVSDRAGGTFQVYVMNADGTDQRRLTFHNEMDLFPAWSPDGTEIVFQSDRELRAIWIMNADGTGQRRLTPSTYTTSSPTWSPDGTKILFHSFKDSDTGEVYVMDRDGSNMVRLTDNSANDYIPRWIPRKRGVEVTGASLAIPGGSTGQALTTQEVTARARDAVVRIETDLGSGSGFVIGSDGLILTSNHVIKDAEEITVYFDDGSSYTGTVEARDLVRDLALVRIEATGLSYLEMGGLSEVGLGQQVLVFGYPLGNENVSVTSGLVSAIEFDSGRNITWVQTDSAINPGNSGGPMLNLQGTVIGIVSAKMVGVAVEGMGFAISVGTVNMYLPRLEAGETIAIY